MDRNIAFHKLQPSAIIKLEDSIWNMAYFTASLVGSFWNPEGETLVSLAPLEVGPVKSLGRLIMIAQVDFSYWKGLGWSKLKGWLSQQGRLVRKVNWGLFILSKAICVVQAVLWWQLPPVSVFWVHLGGLVVCYYHWAWDKGMQPHRRCCRTNLVHNFWLQSCW